MLNNKVMTLPIRYLVFIVILLGVSFGAAKYKEHETIKNNDLAITQALDKLAQNIANEVTTATKQYEYALNGLRAAIKSHGVDQLTYQSHLNYFLNRDYAKEFPGARGFGVIKRVEVNEVDEYLTFIRHDRGDDFVIKSLQPHQQSKFIIQYIEPEQNNVEAVGLDIGSEQNRRQAAIYSALVNQTTLTAPITLVQKDNATNHGFLLLLPLFNDDEKSSLFGWVYAPLLINEILSTVSDINPNVVINIADSSTRDIVHFYKNSTEQTTPYTSESNIDIYTRIWQMSVTARPAFIESLNLDSPTADFFSYLISGLILSVFLIVTLSYSIKKHDLTKRQLELAAVAENTNNAVLGLNDSFFLQSWNTAASELFNHKTLDESVQFIQLFATNNSVEELIQTFNQLKKGVAVKNLRLNSPIDDGKIYLLNAMPVFNKTEFNGATVNIIDDTENSSIQTNLELTQKGLNQTISLYSEAVNRTNNILFWVKQDGTIIHSNPSAQEIIQTHDTNNIKDLFFGDFFWSELWQKLTHENEISQQFKIRSAKISTHISVIVSMNLLQQDAEEQIAYLSATDISPQIQQEDRLTAALHEAEAAVIAKNSFLSNMSHELRTPLSEIHGLMQMLELTAIDYNQQRLLKTSKSSVLKLTKCVDMLIESAMLEQNKIKLSEEEFDLFDLIQDVGSHLNLLAESKPIEILFTYKPPINAAYVGDRNKIKNVLCALGENAIKYTANGHVILSVSAHETTSGYHELIFKVTDTGIGIEKHRLNSIFDLFSQINDQYNKRYQGVGIGLSNAARFVNLLNGQITVKSEVNQGSEFTVSLPLKPQQAPVSILEQQHHKQYKVLIVDDNPTALTIMTELSEQLGWSVRGVQNAEDALRLVNESCHNDTPYDIILADWALPDIDGLQMAEQIVQLDHKNNAPLIMLVSAHSRVELNKAIQKYELSPIDGYLSKPVTPYSLLDAVEDALAFNRSEMPPSFATKFENKPLKNLHILIVEDNAVNQEIAQSLLVNAGATCEVVSGGMAAVSTISKSSGRFNLILMDIQMPDLDGYETTMIIRKDPNYHSIPIIAMTANVLQRDKEHCLRAGMNAHIGKPYDVDTLVSTIYAVLGLDQYDTEQSPPPLQPIKQQQVPSEVLRYCQTHQINIAASMALLNDSFELYVKSTRIFEKQLSQTLDDIEPSQFTIADILAACHSLKTSTKSLGFAAATEVLENMEVSCKQHDNKDAIVPSVTTSLIKALQSASTHCKELLSLL